ncbi:MAG TPA: hypothetical protein VKG26_00885 [Bacteroidia bacterium]|nr:hypothetical protein [Bacteroidia bacterium]
MKPLSLKLIPFLILTLALTSCNTQPQTATTQNPKLAALLKNYKQTTVPIVIRGCDFQHGFPLINFDSLSNDSSGMAPYCTFKTNGNYTALIMLGAADCSLPFIITYNTAGKEISNVWAGIGYCGAGPGFHCSEYMTIKSDFSIYVSDTISEAEVDSLSNEIPSTLNKYVLYKKGKLLSNGVIELSDTIRQKLNN